jgi:hypothetical protein
MGRPHARSCLVVQSLLTGYFSPELDSTVTAWRSLVLERAQDTLRSMSEACGGTPMSLRVLDRGWEKSGKFLSNPMFTPARPLLVGVLLIRIVRIDVDSSWDTRVAPPVAVMATAGASVSSSSILLPTGCRVPHRGPGLSDLCIALDRHPKASTSDSGPPKEAPGPEDIANARRLTLMEAPVDAEAVLWLLSDVPAAGSDPGSVGAVKPSAPLARVGVEIQHVIRDTPGSVQRVSRSFLNPESGFSGAVTMDLVYRPLTSWEQLDRVQHTRDAALTQHGVELASMVAQSPLRRPPSTPQESLLGGVESLTSMYLGVLVVHIHSALNLPVSDVATGSADP